jgi:hypothetical protein
MGKVRKTLYLDEQLTALFQEEADAWGSDFSLRVMGTMLRELFETFAPEWFRDRLQHHWIAYAASISRGELRLEDLPNDILECAVKTANFGLRAALRESDKTWMTTPLAEWEQLVVETENLAQGWKNDIEDFGGKLGAIRDRVLSWPRAVQRYLAQQDQPKSD